MTFNIRDLIDFDSKGRAVCPCCASDKSAGYNKKNLSVSDSGAYKCFRGCTPHQIREALGSPKDQVVPTNLVTRTEAKPVTVTPQKVREAQDRLLTSSKLALDWLLNRGFSLEMIERFQLGVVQTRIADRRLWAISIPIPTADRLQYYQKKRVAPWLPSDELPAEYHPWSQKGIPQQVFFTHLPVQATQTYLCEGEWDAMLMGWKISQSDQADQTAVACFTCGAGSVPPQEQLDRLPGQVVIFYDRNDEPLKDGSRPGEKGAKKVAAALDGRGKIAAVPMPDDCTIAGWDVSDAFNAGFTLGHFDQAAALAEAPIPKAKEKEQTKENPLRARLVSNDELLARAPDYTDWLVHDLLTSNELFVLATSPRGGKTLMAMTLAHCVASGQKFLDRPVTQGAVIYVNLEDNEGKVKEREIAQGWEEGLPVYWLDKFKLEDLPYLLELIEEIQPRLVVLDTLSRIRNDSVGEASAEMSQVLEPLQNMARDCNVCVLMIHHTKKVTAENAESVDVFDSIRGSSAIRATCRGAWILAPDDQCYRLFVEHGYGKHDLKILLNPENLRWRLIGQWNPMVNADQKTIILDCLTKLGQATVTQLSEVSGINAKSVGTVLGRLQADDMVTKQGGRGRTPAIYSRSSNLLQQLEQKLEHPNPDSASDTALLQQKTTFFPTDNASANCQTGSNDELAEKTIFVGTSTSATSNLDSASDTSSNDCSNSLQVVGANPDLLEQSHQFKWSDLVEVLLDGQWVEARYVKPARRSGDEHWVNVGTSRHKVTASNLRAGWV